MMRARAILLFSCLALRTMAQDPLCHRTTVREGAPSNTVYSLAQDRSGFVWFGTSEGAVRTDGKHLDVFSVDQGVTDGEVFRVWPDSHGRVWFLTGNGRPSYMENGLVVGPAQRPELGRVWLRSGIRSMVEDRQGALWFGGLNGDLAVLHRDGTVTGRVVKDPLVDRIGGHITLAPDGEGGIGIFTGPRKVPGDGKHAPLLVEDTSLADGVTFLFPSGRMFTTAAHCVKEWKGGSWEKVFDARDIGTQGTFRRAFDVGPDEVWLALQEGGLRWLKRKDGRWQDQRGLMFREELVNDVIRDREGNLWIATAYTGVIRVSEDALATHFYPGAGLAGEEFQRVAVDPRTGQVWCGTNQGDLYRLEAVLERVDLPPAGPHYNRVNDLLPHGDHLYVATDDRTLRMHRSGAVEELLAHNPHEWEGLKRAGMKGMMVAPNGRLIASFYGIYELDQRDVLFERIALDMAPEVRIYAPVIDRSGTLWYDDQGRLCSVENGVLHTHPGVALRPGVRITDLALLGDTLVVATSGQGLLLYHDGRVLSRFARSDGLASGSVNRLFVHDGELFVATAQGLDRISGIRAGAPRVSHGFETMGGVTNTVRDVAVHDGRVYAVLENGLCVIPLRDPKRSAHVPVPYVRTVHMNDSLVQVGPVLGFRSGRDRMVLDLAAIQFEEPDRVVIEHRMGEEGPWQPTYGGLLDLSGMPAGDHRLQVRARLGHDAWSAPVVMDVVVVPRLIDRWWARVLMVFAVLTGVYLAMRHFATRRLRRHEERQRERELVAHERQRIAMDLHDDLGAELSSMLLLTRLQRQHPAANGMERLEQLAGSLTEKMKEVIWSTDPGHDSLEATISFIQKHAAGMCARHGLMMRTQLPPKLPAMELSARVRRELFLLAKEALNNTLKHSAATTVSIEARAVGGGIELVFADDGRGFDEAGGGRGMRNMTERARSIGAALQVDGRAKGTRITLTLPLGDNRPNG